LSWGGALKEKLKISQIKKPESSLAFVLIFSSLKTFSELSEESGSEEGFLLLLKGIYDSPLFKYSYYRSNPCVLQALKSIPLA